MQTIAQSKNNRVFLFFIYKCMYVIVYGHVLRDDDSHLFHYIFNIFI